jgi:FkbM family methyltransferase
LKPPFLCRLFRTIVEKSGAAQDEKGIAASAVRRGVTAGVRLLQRLRRMEFPARATGGWYWIWRWRFEFLMEWFEWESVAWTRGVVKPGMIALDLGAHIGYYTRILSKLVGPMGKVLAFEPNPENVEVLRRNLRGYRNVEIYPYAVSDANGTCTLFISPGHSNHSLVAGFTQAEGEVEVQAVAIDGLGLGSVGFIKMDVEGAESLALQGMRETIGRSKGLHLLMEFNPPALQAAGVPPESFLELIRSLGLEPWGIAEDGSLRPVVEVPKGGLYVNLLCRADQVTARGDPKSAK